MTTVLHTPTTEIISYHGMFLLRIFKFNTLRQESYWVTKGIFKTEQAALKTAKQLTA